MKTCDACHKSDRDLQDVDVTVRTYLLRLGWQFSPHLVARGDPDSVLSDHIMSCEICDNCIRGVASKIERTLQEAMPNCRGFCA